VSAILKDEDTGAVWIDQETCIGCRSCEQACPYNIPVLNEDTGSEVKCDMCRDYLAEGKMPIFIRAWHC
jgi:anaerobic dimethyl sulfoxide reductase subunit B (iron-sulfur subunit)